MPEPISRCGACGQSDDHPKHMVLVGFQNPNTGGSMFHEHDNDRDGIISYHFDCPTPWHTSAGVDTEHIRKIGALAGAGTHGDALRARIVGGDL